MDKRVERVLKSSLLESKYGLKELMRDFPELEEAKFYYAKTIIKLECSNLYDIQLAIELLKNIKEYKKERVYYQIAKGYDKLKKFSKAKEWLYYLENSDNEVYKYRSIKKHADICYKEGNITDAINIYKSILNENNKINLNKVKLNLGILYSENKQTELARELLIDILDTDFSSNVKLELGKLEVSACNYEEALKYFEDLLNTTFEKYIINDYGKLKMIVSNIKKEENNNSENLEISSKQKVKNHV